MLRRRLVPSSSSISSSAAAASASSSLLRSRRTTSPSSSSALSQASTSTTSSSVALPNAVMNRRFITAQRDMLGEVMDQHAKLHPDEHHAVLKKYTLVAEEFDAFTKILLFLSFVNVVIMYMIIFDWIYSGFLLLWDGTYGLDDDDDDDEDEEI